MKVTPLTGSNGVILTSIFAGQGKKKCHQQWKELATVEKIGQYPTFPNGKHGLAGIQMRPEDGFTTITA